MIRSRFLLMVTASLAMLALMTPRAAAEDAQPLDCTWEASYGPVEYGEDYAGNGVYSDGNISYNHTSTRNAVRCYLGVNGRDVDLVTYNSGRTLHFKFPAGMGVPAGAGSDDDLNAEVDLFGVNYFGPFRTMTVGSTALLQVDLEFHYPEGPNPLTYELDYRALAVQRTGEEEWLITSNPFEICGHLVCSGLGFTPSPLANLNVIRRKSVETIRENVQMPIRFRVKYQASSTDGGGGGGGRGPKNK